MSYIIENNQIKWQIELAESALGRKLSEWEQQLFEYAYIQGKEDLREGKVK